MSKNRKKRDTDRKNNASEETTLGSYRLKEERPLRRRETFTNRTFFDGRERIERDILSLMKHSLSTLFFSGATLESL